MSINKFEGRFPSDMDIIKKINEIIQELNTIENNRSCVVERFQNLEKKVEDDSVFIDNLCELQEAQVELNKCIDQDLKNLQKRAILKPDYEPAEVGLNLVPCNGTFEWACMQLRKGRVVKRDSQPYAICLGVLCNKFVAHLANECFDWNFSTSDILATDWDVVK